MLYIGINLNYCVMERKNGIKTYYGKSRQHWRKWLEKNHQKEKCIWLIIFKKDSGVATVNYQEAVDEALCFGWIDSKANKRDEKSYYQFFAKRNPASKWSKVNKLKVSRLAQQGLMTKAGWDAVKVAKKRGTWTALNEVERLVVPPDLQQLLDADVQARQNWELFSRSSRRGILEWISNARKPETRQKRIAATVELASKNIKANQYNP